MAGPSLLASNDASTSDDDSQRPTDPTIPGTELDSESDGIHNAEKKHPAGRADQPKDGLQPNRHLTTSSLVQTQPSDTTESFLSDQSLYADGMGESGIPLLRQFSPSPAGSFIFTDIHDIHRSTVHETPAWRIRVRAVWVQSKGMAMVLLSQFFGASMNVMTQVLEVDGTHGPAMDPFQVLFARMSITVIFSYVYMWYKRVPHPFGTLDILWLLIFRAVGGFFGVFGLYYSVKYMPLSEATVLTFLAPILACYACSLLIPNETFTRKQQFAGLVSLVGVVLIARPFSTSSSSPPPVAATASDEATKGEHAASTAPFSTDTYHHILAILIAMLGVLGAACAYTSIRMVGKRAHPLVTVTYFSVFATLVSIVAMAAFPAAVPFRLPGNVTEWALLVALGVCGFVLQFLLTAGLAYEPPPPPTMTMSRSAHNAVSGHGSRATSMVYTQMLFALFYDKVVWGSTMSALSWAGSGLILGSAIYVAVWRDGAAQDSGEDSSTSIIENDRGAAAGRSKDDTSTGQTQHIEDGIGLLALDRHVDAGEERNDHRRSGQPLDDLV